MPGVAEPLDIADDERHLRIALALATADTEDLAWQRARRRHDLLVWVLSAACLLLTAHDLSLFVPR